MLYNSPVLEVKELTKIYQLGDVQVNALSGVTLRVALGEMICIMGKSGSGKSTLLRQLGLIDFPTSGSIFLEGIDVTRLAERKRSLLRLEHLGYVFQEYALIPELTALENVYLPAMMLGTHRDYRKKAAEVLDIVGLTERIGHRPKELSGGEQQRVAIARALINDPKTIFADEPTANLDTTSAAKVMKTLVDLNDDLKVTIVFVSHDPDDKKYAKDLVFLKDGKQVEEYI